MDQTQQKALNALESYVLLAKSATSPRAAIDLITQATSAPNTYVFAELLQTPKIQALRTASLEQASYLTLLEIFAWGTWADYLSTPNLPPLSDSQSNKLRQLTLLTLSSSPTTLTYPSLLTALSLPTTRQLEDLVISSIYAGLLTAKLDTLAQRIDVSSVSPLRDLRPNNVPTMISVLEDWDSRCGDVLKELEERVRDVRKNAAEQRRRELDNEKAVEKAMGEDWGKGKAGGKRGARDEENGIEGGGDLMDVDDRAGRERPRNAKRGGRFAGIGKKLG